MSIIEQAARRLEELRKAGVDVPWGAGEGKPGEGASSDGRPSRKEQRRARGRGRPEGLGAAAGIEGAAESGGRSSQAVELNLDALRTAGILLPGDPRSELADEMRVIKRPLIRNMQAGAEAPARANLVLVTSALPGEGKTFIAINLAMSLAMELDRQVLLVDADVVRSSLIGRLGLTPGRGLLDLLNDPALEPADVLLRTNIPKLTLLPAGTPCVNSTELLASPAMDQLLDELSSRYPDRIVVFDAPPLLPTTECQVLATRVGQVVMAVAAEQTPQSAVTQAFAALESCPVVLSVLNKCTTPALVKSYGYGGYGYGY